MAPGVPLLVPAARDPLPGAPLTGGGLAGGCARVAGLVARGTGAVASVGAVRRRRRCPPAPLSFSFSRFPARVRQHVWPSAAAR
jgi:hypothetical protein